MSRPLVEEIAAIDLFEGVEASVLERLAELAEIEEWPSGTIISQPGDTPRLSLLLEGRAEALVADGAHFEPVGIHAAPTWIGAINSVTGAPFGVQMVAVTPVRLARVPGDEFVEIALGSREIFQRVMARVRPVTAQITAREQARDRLASLGTMAAGLAHELNNPASAAQRSAAQLADVLDILSSTVGVFVDSGMERADAAELVAMQRRALAEAAERPAMGTLEASDAEEALADAMTQIGVADAYSIAEPLSRAGVDTAFLERVHEIAGSAAGGALQWIAASLTARELAGELADSTARMSDLVKAVKQYAYMDRGKVVEVDVAQGLDTTLKILGHKLKHTQIKVVRDYQPDLPRFMGLGAELNQVWTNLLDNAIDALGESGTITLTIRAEGSCLEVDIADDGPGIPIELRDRIFDPFFTTKEVGSGTGLGLDTARRIVVDRHHGSLQLDSTPGRTVFRTRLPLTP